MEKKRTNPASGDAGYPSTHWSVIERAQDADEETRREALNQLIERYWLPVFRYIRSHGYDIDPCKDHVQEFFTVWWLEKRLFQKADSSKGRFRSFMLTSLNNYLHNAERKKRALKRRPPGGFVSIEALASMEHRVLSPVTRDNPEKVFHKSWAEVTLTRILHGFQEKCTRTGKETHFEIFRRTEIDPILYGAEKPTIKDLASCFSLTEKQATNRKTTAQRILRKILLEEVRPFTLSEQDLSAEVEDVIRVFQSG